MSDAAQTTVIGHAVQGDDGRMWVDVPRRSACQSCGKASGCGMSVLGGLGGNAPIRLAIEDVPLNAGDPVALACPSAGLLKAAFLAYGLPAVGLVVGAVSAAMMNFGDGAQVLGAGLGLGLGVMTTRWAVARGQLPTMTLMED